MQALENTLPPLREVIAKYHLSAKKSLGQNFLLDLQLTRRIARAAGSLAGATVLEIGSGPGGLTRALLLEGAERVIAIERDSRCLNALEDLSRVSDDRLFVIAADALKVCPQDIIPTGPIKIIANLPYNVATPLFMNWLENSERIVGGALMFQKEVGMRVTAKVGTKAYGRLSVIAQWRAEVSCAFDVSPKAFAPAPKIWSTVVNFTVRQQPLFPAKPEALVRILKIAFGQRRKMLRQSLKRLVNNPRDLLAAANIAETERPENLSVRDFCRLAQLYVKSVGE